MAARTRNVGFCRGVVGSKPAPFLHEPQKKCGTHAGFDCAEREGWCRAETLLPAERQKKRLARHLRLEKNEKRRLRREKRRGEISLPSSS
jgi:hypothetical protein